MEAETGRDGGQRHGDADQPRLVEGDAGHDDEDRDNTGSHYDSQGREEQVNAGDRAREGQLGSAASRLSRDDGLGGCCVTMHGRPPPLLS